MLSPEHWARVTELFGELADLPPAERAARLAALDGADVALRTELEELLRAADSVGDRFDESPAYAATEDAQVSMTGQRVGAYEIVREVGRGGMGTVYEGRRVDEQFTKRVAIKMVAGSARSEQTVRRFRRERQLLARLEHRNIATLLDGGVTEHGQPYFVMEYVDGKPIDRWCAERNLTTRQRLELFRQVCTAVQYAHEHLVVHRDLKPGNILVGEDGTVKLLDFGVAKLLDVDLTGDDALTNTGVLPMTAAYASPEQLRGDPVSTSSDIYSLGVVLYELLASRRPFDLRKGGTALTAGRPVTPSRAVTDPESTVDRAVAQRLHRELSGEVDSIVMMALRPEVDRRYRSVQQLSEDIHRYLLGQRVAAQPDTIGYRTAKFVRRNRVGVASATLAVLALIAATIFSARQARVARAERDRAVLEAQRTEHVTQFFRDVLTTAKPQEQGRDITVLEAIDLVIPRIDTTFANQDDLRSAIKNTLGSVLSDMSHFERAQPLLVDALRLRQQIDGDRPSREQADAIYNLASTELELGSAVRAESLFTASLTMYGKLPGSDSSDIYRGMNNLAGAVLQQGRLEDAAELYGKVVDRLAVRDARDTVTRSVALTNYATALATLGRYVEAEPRLREAVVLMERVRGKDDPRVASALQPLSGSLLFQKKFAEAAEVAQRSWEINRRAVGPDNPQTVASQRMLMNILADAGKCVDALRHAREIISFGATLPAADPSLGTALLYAGWCESELGNPAQGAVLAREGLALRQKHFPENHWAIASAESTLGDILARRGPTDSAEAGALLRRGYAGMKRELDSTHVRVLQARERLLRFEGRAR